jgi:tetratricopeptide (TPR) repeat protein
MFQGKNEEAIEYYEKALAIRRHVFGEDNAATAASYNNIGLAKQRTGHNAEAAEYFEKGLRIRMATLGPNHPETGNSLNNVAMALLVCCQFSKSRFQNLFNIFRPCLYHQF